MGKWQKHLIITLDGPAASGKSTTARLVAQKLGWLYLDTGAMYRAMAVKILKLGISVDDQETIARIVRKTSMRLEQSEFGMRVFVDDEEVTDRIRTPEIDQAVGPVCEVPAVREEMVRLQRDMAEYGHLITEGRDMGTVVFPKADLKFYIIASIEARASRRKADMEKQGIDISLDKLMEEIERRDERDSTRDHSPLRPAKDAIKLDTSHLEINEQVEIIIRHIDREIRKYPCHMLSKSYLYHWALKILPPLCKALFGFQVLGRENFPMFGSVLVAPNHVSLLDPPIVGTAAPREMHFFAKAELFKVPILKDIISRTNAFPVRREAGDRGAIRAAFSVLSGKNPLLMFPEGTRSRDGKIHPAKSGIGMIAYRNQVDVLPVLIEGTYKFSFRQLWRRRIKVTFGKPIQIQPYLNCTKSKKDIFKEIGDLTTQRLKELKDGHYH